jgi:predicted DNA-binding transcriptional regulator AlpA
MPFDRVLRLEDYRRTIGRWLVFDAFSVRQGKKGILVKLIDLIEAKNEALRVRDIARILGVSAQQIYKMAAMRQLPSFRVANAIRFDPQVFATWLREKYPSQHVVHTQRTVRSA